VSATSEADSDPENHAGSQAIDEDIKEEQDGANRGKSKAMLAVLIGLGVTLAIGGILAVAGTALVYLSPSRATPPAPEGEDAAAEPTASEGGEQGEGEGGEGEGAEGPQEGQEEAGGPGEPPGDGAPPQAAEQAPAQT